MAPTTNPRSPAPGCEVGGSTLAIRCAKAIAERRRSIVARVSGVGEELLAHFGDELRYVSRHLPLPVHPHSELAALAAVELGLSVRGMERRMDDAWVLVTELPAAHEAAAAGRITTAHLRVIEGETRAVRHDRAIDAEQRARVVDELRSARLDDTLVGALTEIVAAR